MEPLIDELKQKIVATLNLEGVNPGNIQTDDPIFGVGLGLDSIDSLELVAMLDRDYGIIIDEMAVAQKAFVSVRSLADFVTQNRKR